MARPLSSPPPARPGQPDWTQLGEDWPHSEHSAFWQIGGTCWHVQRMGHGPPALLLHGTGAATHSWAGLMPLLAERFDVIAVDLPGHGFSRPAPGFRPTLNNMAEAAGDLCDALEVSPHLFIGHSAGAAIAIRLAARGQISPDIIVSLNGALRPFPGLLRHLAPSMAKTLTFGGVAANMFASAAKDRPRVERLLEQTGGAPDLHYVGNYQKLLVCSAHVSSTLSMMANWDLDGIERDLESLDMPVLFLAGSEDQAISPAEAPRLAGKTPQGKARRLKGLGHLAHEQDPAAVMAEIIDFLPSPPASP